MSDSGSYNTYRTRFVKYRNNVFTFVEYQQHRVISGENPQINRRRLNADAEDPSIAAAMR